MINVSTIKARRYFKRVDSWSNTIKRPIKCEWCYFIENPVFRKLIYLQYNVPFYANIRYDDEYEYRILKQFLALADALHFGRAVTSVTLVFLRYRATFVI